jgi:hypothetical protein
VRATATLLFLAAALINLAPMIGVTSAARLEAAYEVTLGDPNLVILMRHRALLFGAVGAALVVAAFHAPFRNFATGVGLVSMLSFVVIALLVGEYNERLRRVAMLDVLGSVLLVGAWLASRAAAEKRPDD